MEFKILIVDDDEDILEILSRWLHTSGNSSITCHASANNLDDILAQSWDLVICDVYMPGANGISICQKLKSSNPDTPVILMTGHVTTELTLKAFDIEVSAFLKKPFDKADLVSKVNKFKQQKLEKSNRSERILAIGAHPDDVEIGCGGTLVRHQERGDSICILTLCAGNQGGEVNRRLREAGEAADLLGADLVLGDLDDTRISEGNETISVINRVINRFNPTIVYTHTLNDAHQDHRNTHRATVVAARGVDTIYAYQSPSSTIQFMPSKFADISSSLTRKMKLIDCYQSQREKCAYLEPSLITSTAQYWGRFSGFSMVEPLEVIKSQ